MFPRLERFDVDSDLPEPFLPEFPPAIFVQNWPELGDVPRGEVVSINNYYRLFTVAATRKSSDRSDLLVRIARVRVTGSEVGLVNRAADPAYRIFLSNVTLTVENVTNQRSEGIGAVHLTGLLMGSGGTDVTMRLRPIPRGPTSTSPSRSRTPICGR